MKVDLEFKDVKISFNADMKDNVEFMIKSVLKAHAEYIIDATPKVILSGTGEPPKGYSR